MKAFKSLIPALVFYVVGTAFLMTCSIMFFSVYAPKLVDWAPILEHSDQILGAVALTYGITYLIKKLAEA